MFKLKTLRDSLLNHSWLIGSFLLMITILFIIRWSTDILNLSVQCEGYAQRIIERVAYCYDEKLIAPPIFSLINDGWTIDAFIHFEKTRAPGSFIAYALLSNLFGEGLNDLRLISLFFSFSSLLILLLIAKLCGAKDKDYLLISFGWLLMPYLIIFSQLVMGEISYIFIAVFSVFIFLWGMNNQDSWKGNLLAPSALFLLLALGLHIRLHMVALIGGILIIAILKKNRTSWPWVLAILLALLSRLPLWILWEGPVGPEYENSHSFGFRIDSMAYLLAALSTTTTIFLVSSWRIISARKWIISAGLFGVAIMFFSQINLNGPPNVAFEPPNHFFAGPIATFIKIITDNEILQKTLLMLFAFLGLGGLMGLFFESIYKHNKNQKIILNLTCYTLFIGCFLYLFTEGFVFDRYLVSWSFLLPLAWWAVLPNKLLIGQYLLLLLINLRLVWVYLF